MNQYNICFGKVIEVSNSTITIKINDEHNRSHYIINAISIRIGGVGSFVKVENDIYEIINEKEVVEIKNEDAIITNRLINCTLVGYFNNGVYRQGSSGNTPNIFENVYTVTDKELNAIYANTTNKSSLKLGHYLFAQNVSFHIDIKKYFASHSLIVGNTGSGKSNTINSIYTNLFDKRNTKQSLFLFIDTNGEYKYAFTNHKKVKHLNTYKSDKNDIQIPMSLLNDEDWKLILEATDKTQFPIIKKVCNYINDNIYNATCDTEISIAILNSFISTLCSILSSNTNASSKLGAINNIIDDLSYYKSPLYVEIQDMLISTFDSISINNSRLVRGSAVFSDVCSDLISEINNYSIIETKQDFNVYDFGILLNNEHTLRIFKYNTNEQNTSPMIARFNTNKKDFSNIFKPFKLNERFDLINTLFDDDNILVCDVTKAKKDIRRIMVTFICSKLYNTFVNHKDSKKSLHLIIDEAHNYLSDQKIDKEDAIAKTCIETFENIIKEGRKFGVFLTISTQRPSEITGTLLSQAHNFIIHKLVNPNDIDIIKNQVPFIDAVSMKMLSILAPGQAIFTGTAFNRPNIVQIKLDNTKTKVESETIDLNNLWQNKFKVKSISPKKKHKGIIITPQRVEHL